MAKNILICDDAAFMRMMIKDILTKNGYNVAGEAENEDKGSREIQRTPSRSCSYGYYNAGNGWYSGVEEN